MTKIKAMDATSQKPITGVHAILSVQNISKSFGNLVALDNLSFNVKREEIFGIAGPNGAGKTTLLNICAGVLGADSGKIRFGGERVDGYTPYRRCHKGLARTFQIPQVFTSLSVYDNVATGAMFGIGKKSTDGQVKTRLVEEILDIAGLRPKRDAESSKIDLLTRKMTMLAAALATKPKLVFMDEPLAGLTSEETDQIVELISSLREKLNVTFIIIEHKVRALSELCDRIMIMHHGQNIALDAPGKVMRDEQVIEVYLGPEYFA